jgi:hypothetical protein
MAATLDLVQAVDLSQLVESEARWENLRAHPAPLGAPSPQADLSGIQKAYEAFHNRLIAYNKQHMPRHIPELLLNTADRLGRWCALMGELFHRVEAEPSARCPVQLIEKAYRRAEAIARRSRQAPVPRRAAPDTVAAAIEDLEILGRWCAALLPEAVTSTASGKQ